jgi:hypothetical protein
LDIRDKGLDVIGNPLPGKTADPNAVLVPIPGAKGMRVADEAYTNLLPDMEVEIGICSTATVARTGAVQVKERLGTTLDSTIRQCQVDSSAPWIILNGDLYAWFHGHVASVRTT